MVKNNNSFFASKPRIASLVVCVLITAAWFASVFLDLGPYSIRFNRIYTHDELTWRKFLVLRLQPTHFAIELWEMPQSQELRFQSDLQFQRHWAHNFSNSEHDWGFIAFDEYNAGIGWVGRANRRQKPTTFPVTGTTSINVRWWFLAALAAVPSFVYFARRFFVICAILWTDLRLSARDPE
jgi:hypothetical protein